VVHICNPSYVGEISRRLQVQGQPKQKSWDSFWKIAKAISAGGVAQVVEHLPNKCKTLNSNPSTNNMRYVENYLGKGIKCGHLCPMWMLTKGQLLQSATFPIQSSHGDRHGWLPLHWCLTFQEQRAVLSPQYSITFQRISQPPGSRLVTFHHGGRQWLLLFGIDTSNYALAFMARIRINQPHLYSWSTLFGWMTFHELLLLAMTLISQQKKHNSRLRPMKQGVRKPDRWEPWLGCWFKKKKSHPRLLM
jgi:hypothetical protein